MVSYYADDDDNYFDKMRKYVIYGLWVAVWLSEKEAWVAILAAIKTCSLFERTMIKFKLQSIMGEWLDRAERACYESDLDRFKQWTNSISKVIAFINEFEKENWNVVDALYERRNLRNIDPEYEKALEYVDYHVFERRHPAFFRTLKRKN
jgi:hypothetical protein